MAKEKSYAAIDIGSNAARLLIKRLVPNEEGQFTLVKQLLLRYPLRLGFDVFEKGKISATKSDDVLRLMKAYRLLMDIHGVTSYRACATSAMRDSKNGSRLIKKIQKKSGIKIDIIDGQEEARMVYDNHLECLEDRKGNYMYVDVGGGSTEVNLLKDGELIFAKSFNIGTIRLLTGGVTEAAWQSMADEIEACTQGLKGINIIGSGGNINKLYKLAETKNKKQKRMTVATLQALYDRLAPMTPAERAAAYSLRPDRADVIEPAGRIFLTIAKAIHATYISVPVIGISDGIIDSLVAKDMEKLRRKAEKAQKQVVEFPSVVEETAKAEMADVDSSDAEVSQEAETKPKAQRRKRQK